MPNPSPHATPQPTRPDWLPTDVLPYDLQTLDTHQGCVTFTDIGSGPTLLFCHAGMWSLVWRDVIDRLSDSYRCIAFDPPGSGLSATGTDRARTLADVRDTIVDLVEHLDLHDVTLVLHDLGGPTALAAPDRLPGRVIALAAVNTFGWRPTGVLFRTMLAIFGSAWMRVLDTVTGWLPAASTTRFGVGRHMDRQTRRAFRAGMHREGRRTMHHLFRSARDSDELYEAVERTTDQLADAPLLTVFGSLGDHLHFRPKWRARFRNVEEVTIPWGLHFPMCDEPGLTASSLADWHRRWVQRRPDDRPQQADDSKQTGT